MKTWKYFFHNFRINILARIVLIYAALMGLVFVILKTSLWTLIFWLSLLTIVLIIELIHYLEKFKERFIYFLDAVNQNDFTMNFQVKNQNEHDRRLAQLLNDVIRKFKNIRSEMEARHHLLRVIVDQVNVGLISYNNKGEILLYNEATRKLLQRPYLNRLEVLRKIDDSLFNAIDSLGSGKKCLVKFIRNGEMIPLSLQATEIKVDEQYMKVITLHDVRRELEEKEIDAWQKLVRVINHEIMNSVIPIATLANVLLQSLNEYLNVSSGQDGEILRNEIDLHELSEGIRTIEERSKGLSNFVGATKSITNLNIPEFINTGVHDLLVKTELLFRSELKRKQINITITETDTTIYILADPEMIEQVLINLVKNAMDAVENCSADKKKIEISTSQHDEHIFIKVRDFGEGIKEDELDNIFIPFFTTKPDGSGIGLPLSRQIMKLHSGTITVKSIYGEGTEFTLIF